MPSAQVGEHVVTLRTAPRYESGTAFGLKGDLGTWANRQLSEIHDFRYVPTSCKK